MSVVVGAAGHIDHGKTSLLRALTGIDADRLPEEQRRGMTIDVGYAHLTLPDGEQLDFVDVPGHDHLIGNMLVGAGEIDAALIVVAADDGPRAQTIEHLELLDALGIREAVAVVTKIDVLADGAGRQTEVAEEVEMLLSRTSMAGAPVLAVSSTTGSGLVALREALVELRDRVRARRAGGDLGGGPGRGPGPTRLAIDRVFAVRGRGVVVTGSLRGGAIERGRTFRLEPGGRIVRAREVQVHGAPVEHATPGRVALNLAGVELDQVHRGMVLGDGAAVEVTERVLVGLRPAVALAGGRARAEGAGIAAAAGSAGNTVGVAGAGSAGTAAAAGDRGVRHGLRVRLHLGTAQVDGAVDLTRGAVATYLDGSGRAWTTAVLRLDEPVATAFGDAFVLRRPSPGETLAGGLVLDPNPPHGISRRRATPERLAALGQATGASDRLADRLAALVELHGALPVPRAAALLAAAGAASSGAGGAAGSAAGDPTSSPAALEGRVAGSMILAADVSAALDDAAISIVAEHAATDALAIGAPVAAVRTQIGRELRRRAFVPRDSVDVVAAGIVDQLVATGRITQSGDRLRIGGADSGPSRELRSAMDRLELALSVAAPASLTEAASSAGCPLDGIRALESAGRIVRVEDDLAWAAPTYLELEALAQRLAASGPLSPAAFRDATGTSRRYSLTILEDLDRRGLLRRTPAGHVLGPRANLARTRS